MYSRGRADGSARTFGVSGKLWHGVLVFFDRDTESLWTQLDGRAVKGPLAGDRLEHYPSTYTTWGAWREAHPDTLVLRKEEGETGQTASHYADYLADPDRLFTEHLSEGLGDVGPKEVVFGVVVGDDALAVTASLLARKGEIEDTVGGEPVVFRYDPTTGGAEVVRRTPGGEDLGPLRLDRAFWYAWARSHRGSRVRTE